MRYEPLPTVRVCPTGMILLLVVLASMMTGPSCHASASEVSSANGSTPTLSQFVAGVLVRSSDLNYITEQDSEVFVFYRNTPVKEVTDAVFLTLLRRPAQTRITQQSWSAFFQLRTRNDPTGRWKDLQEYLEANLTNVTVFRLPREDPYGAQYDLYAVGIFDGDTIVGVQMFGVAT